MNQPTTPRLSGALADIWVSNDGADILIHGVLTTAGKDGESAECAVTFAVDPDLAPIVADLLGQEVAELDATGSGIDDHDEARDEARAVA